MSEQLMAKAFMQDGAGRPLFLFHGLHGSRRVPLDRWISARKVWAQDGSSGTTYLTGFHCLPDHQSIDKWAKSLIHDKLLANVQVRNVWIKTHSNHGVMLAEEIYLSSEAWDHARVLKAQRAR